MEFIAQVFQRDLEHTTILFIPSRQWKVIEANIITATLTNWVLYNILCVILSVLARRACPFWPRGLKINRILRIRVP